MSAGSMRFAGMSGAFALFGTEVSPLLTCRGSLPPKGGVPRPVTYLAASAAMTRTGRSALLSDDLNSVNRLARGIPSLPHRNYIARNAIG